jgi:hypothetical protein
MFRAMLRARPRWRTGALAAGAVLLAAGVLSAGGTLSFRQTTAKDFEEGEATASVILPSGELVPGLAATRLPVEAAFVWSSAISPDGRTAYFGTGDQGRLYAVTLRQGSSAPTVRKLCDLGSPWITSLAVRPDGTLLVGSTPGGRVFTVDPARPEPRQLAKLGAEHVWSLAHDPRTGVTYAGTGGAGKVFAIDAKGASRLVWDSGDKQVVSLLSLGGGTLLAGTAVEGVLYRVHPDGRGEALHDFDADEVRAILRTGNATYVAVNDFLGQGDAPGPIGGPSTSGGGSSAASPSTKGTRITLGGATPPASAGGVGRPSGGARGRGAVYRLDDSGTIEQVFALSDGYLTALLGDRNGDVLAAAGTQGKVYRLFPDRTFALAADLSERQALTLVRTGDGFLVGTGDVGGVYEVRPASPGQANYLSRVFDGDFFSAWGRLRWSGSDGLTFETRSGNTAKPDKSWSGWKKLEDVKAAPAGGGEGRVASSASRYAQYRLTFPAKGGSLKEVQLYYLPQNQRPRVTDVYLADAPSGGASAGGAAASTAGATRAHASVLKLRWKVENPDGDTLIYRLGYRQEREAVWRPLGGGDPLTKAEFDWNTDSVPDGSYLVRVWVTDERSNSSERALDSTFVSAPFLVDNTRPEIRDLSSKAPVVTGRALDAASVVSQVEFSVDGEEWRPVTPRDGLLDQNSEEFIIRLPTDLSRGPHVVNVRAWDGADNLGAGRIQVETK